MQAILFDLDGTLLDTLTDIAESMNIAMKRFGFDVHPVDSYRYFVGDFVAGSATVILAMRHGRAAAQSINEYLEQKRKRP